MGNYQAVYHTIVTLKRVFSVHNLGWLLW